MDGMWGSTDRQGGDMLDYRLHPVPEVISLQGARQNGAK